MYNPINTVKNLYDKLSDVNVTLQDGAVIGGVVGGLAGFVIPAYTGWEIGVWVKNGMDLGFISGPFVKGVSAAGLITLAAPVTVPLGFFSGYLGGIGVVLGAEILGAGISVTKDKIKKSLENLTNKKDD